MSKKHHDAKIRVRYTAEKYVQSLKNLRQTCTTLVPSAQPGSDQELVEALVMAALATSFRRHTPGDGLPGGVESVSPTDDALTIRLMRSQAERVLAALMTQTSSTTGEEFATGLRIHAIRRGVEVTAPPRTGRVIIDPGGGAVGTSAIHTEDTPAARQWRRHVEAHATAWSTTVRRLGLFAGNTDVDFTAGPPQPSDLAGPNPDRIDQRPRIGPAVPQRQRRAGAFVVTASSPKGGAGVSTMLANLAAAWALQGRRVLIVDADRQATQSWLWGVEQLPDEEKRAVAEDIPDAGSVTVHLLPELAGDVPEAGWIQRTVDEARGQFDIVIIDPARQRFGEAAATADVMLSLLPRQHMTWVRIEVEVRDNRPRVMRMRQWLNEQFNPGVLDELQFQGMTWIESPGGGRYDFVDDDDDRDEEFAVIDVEEYAARVDKVLTVALDRFNDNGEAEWGRDWHAFRQDWQRKVVLACRANHELGILESKPFEFDPGDIVDDLDDLDEDEDEDLDDEGEMDEADPLRFVNDIGTVKSVNVVENEDTLSLSPGELPENTRVDMYRHYPLSGNEVADHLRSTTSRYLHDASGVGVVLVEDIRMRLRDFGGVEPASDEDINASLAPHGMRLTATRVPWAGDHYATVKVLAEPDNRLVRPYHNLAAEVYANR